MRLLLLLLFVIFVAFEIYSLYQAIRIGYFASAQQSTKILDRNSKLLFEIPVPQKGYQNYIKLEEINPYIKESVILLEDRSFYHNPGIDIKRIMKCVYENISSHKTRCGASTITQQYVKFKLGQQNRNYLNKILEIAISVNLSLIKSKDHILEEYLNSIYYSNLFYGIETASHGYFGKPSKNLDLAQAAFLAGIPNSPQFNNPYTNIENSKLRQQTVLELLLKFNKIDELQYQNALKGELNLKANQSVIKAPHFVDYVQEQLKTSGNSANEIVTTIDLVLYEKIKKSVDKNIDILSRLNANNASVVVMDAKSGEIIALVGSKNYFDDSIDGKVNSATALHNPGSTIKPFIYALGLSKGLTPATKINDKVQVFETFDNKLYVPRNYDRAEHGLVTVREALANSFNIPAVSVLKFTGIQDFYSLANRIGLEEAQQLNADLASALGGFSVNLVDLTNAYRIFANQGDYAGDPKIFSTHQDYMPIEKLYGPDSREVSYIIYDILSDQNARRKEFGSLSNLRMPFKAAAKTGTSTDFRDSWTIGYTSDYVVGVWVGNNDNSQMVGVNGVTGAGRIWQDTMLIVNDYYVTKTGKHDFTIPSPASVKLIDYCTLENFNSECTGELTDLIIENSSQKIVPLLDTIDPNLIAIEDPVEGDTFFYEDNLKLNIKFHSNSARERYIIFLNNLPVKESVFNHAVIEAPIGTHTLQVKGINTNETYESQVVSFKVE